MFAHNITSYVRWNDKIVGNTMLEKEVKEFCSVNLLLLFFSIFSTYYLTCKHNNKKYFTKKGDQSINYLLREGGDPLLVPQN